MAAQSQGEHTRITRGRQGVTSPPSDTMDLQGVSGPSAGRGERHGDVGQTVAAAAARLVALAAPTRITGSSRRAGLPSTSRCVMVAGPAQIWQIACSLSASSAWASSCGIGPNGSPRKSRSRPAASTRAPRRTRRSATSTIAVVEELHLVDADHERRVERRDAPRCPSLAADGDAAQAAARVRDDVAAAVAVVQARLEEQGESWAISARRMRRRSSSLLPENIGPQMTSREPPRAGRNGITRAAYGRFRTARSSLTRSARCV